MPLDNTFDVTAVRDRAALLEEAADGLQTPAPTSIPDGKWLVSCEVTSRETRTHLVEAETEEDAISDLRDFYLYGTEAGQVPPRLVKVRKVSDADDPAFDAQPAPAFQPPDYSIFAATVRDDVREAAMRAVRDLADDEVALAALPADVRIRLTLLRRLMTVSGIDAPEVHDGFEVDSGLETGDHPEPACPPSPPPAFQNWL